jgi:hypothetical protein
VGLDREPAVPLESRRLRGSIGVSKHFDLNKNT